jgi:hypothetical protein
VFLAVLLAVVLEVLLKPAALLLPPAPLRVALLGVADTLFALCLRRQSSPVHLALAMLPALLLPALLPSDVLLQVLLQVFLQVFLKVFLEVFLEVLL